MSSSVQSLIDYGTTGLVVDIECNFSNNLPTIVIVGFANRAVDEARERVRGAFASSNLELPRKRITINLAPADVPKDSSSFDLAIAAAILQAAAEIRLQKSTRTTKQTTRTQQTTKTAADPASIRLTSSEAVMGELGLDGSIRPVRGIIGKILAGRRAGITTFYIPSANFTQAALVPGIRIVALSKLSELSDYLSGGTAPQVVETGDGLAASVTETLETSPDAAGQAGLNLSDIIGQHQAKRALEIAAAGGHNLLLNGPPGTGKSMLARALPSIMPDLTREEMLEVTHLHSLSGKRYDRIISLRPFRAPHHSASHVAITGGGAGSQVRPGEISLAHRGVLFFDELPEFNRPTIEALRQPLEDRHITIARANDRVEFPASFILIATANPCPCGYYGVASLRSTSGSAKPAVVAKQCDCAPAAIARYRAKLSGPIMDRIDLYSDVHEVDHAKLLDGPGTQGHQDDAAMRSRIAAARKRQAARYGSPSTLNASMTNRDITRHARLQPEAKALLDTAGTNLDLSARAYMRTIKVARTIADLAASTDIRLPHITEALQYRGRS